MTNAIESREARNARLFKKDVAKWLEGKRRPVPLPLLNVLRVKWCVDQDESVTNVLSELGWTVRGGMLTPNPKPELPESTITVELKPPTEVRVPFTPKASHRRGPENDSDGAPYRLDTDA